MNVVLWHIEISHYNEKARWALDYKHSLMSGVCRYPACTGIAARPLLTRAAQRETAGARAERPTHR